MTTPMKDTVFYEKMTNLKKPKEDDKKDWLGIFTEVLVKERDYDYAEDLGAIQYHFSRWLIEGMNKYTFYKKLKEMKENDEIRKKKKTYIRLHENDYITRGYVDNSNTISLFDNETNRDNGVYFISFDVYSRMWPVDLLNSLDVSFFKFDDCKSLIGSPNFITYRRKRDGNDIYGVGKRKSIDILKLLNYDYSDEDRNILFKACKKNYEIIKYCLDEENELAESFKPIYKKLSKYKNRRLKQINKYFINDVSNMIMDYIIKL